MRQELIKYTELLGQIKLRIRQGQTRAVFAANTEMILTYWDIGRMILGRQESKGWGASVIPRLSRDIRNELPEVKGFSERNIGRMIAFYRAYPTLGSILPQAVAKSQPAEKVSVIKVPQPVAKLPDNYSSEILQPLVARIPWGHNILLMEKIKDLKVRIWYMQKILDQGWSRSILVHMIECRAHERQGKAIHNFESRLPSPQSDLVQQTLKDPYVFDFLTLEEPFHERELEINLIRHLEKFLLELGQGFAFVGRQYHLDIGEEDFYIDLLFYHLKLRCFVVIELKKGGFKPEYAGKMNFYCNIVDDRLRHAGDNPTIGLILCQNKKSVLAEYTLRGVAKPIGVSEYELTRALPDSIKSALPSVEEIERELGEQGARSKKCKTKKISKEPVS
jgi:predicted nuclease of restriction endonuclease-like (RecB) superfamily